MNVTDEDLMAFADGELSGADAERVSSAVAADPGLAVRIEAEQRLRTMLGDHLAPVAAEPVPESLMLMIVNAAADETERDMTDAPVGDHETPRAPGQVLHLAGARAKRKADARASAAARGRSSVGRYRNWGMRAAIAASLVLGVVLGAQLPGRGVVTERDGTLFASGSLAKGLDTQLASAGSGAEALRILTSFRRTGGDFCRVFDGGGTSGIACKHDGRWTLERTLASGAGDAGEYRQAGSAQEDVMAVAQGMAAGEPLDAAQERAAQATGWRGR